MVDPLLPGDSCGKHHCLSSRGQFFDEHRRARRREMLGDFDAECQIVLPFKCDWCSKITSYKKGRIDQQLPALHVVSIDPPDHSNTALRKLPQPRTGPAADI